MLATFILANRDWNDLCPLYRNSPYFSIDVEVITSTSNSIVQNVETQMRAVDAPQPPSTCDGVVADTKHTYNSKCNSSLDTVSANCRQVLRQLIDATYLCDDPVRLLDLNNTLNTCYQHIAQYIPNDDGLALNVNIPTRKSKSLRLAKRRQCDAAKRLQQCENAVRQGIEVRLLSCSFTRAIM